MDNLPSQLVDGGALIAIVAMLGLVRQRIPKSWKKWLWVFAIIFSIAFQFSTSYETGSAIGKTIWTGLILGLAASGTWSGAKSSLEAKTILTKKNKKK